jgi:tricorn protease
MVSLADLKVLFDPLAEWKQIFNETWRMERDFFYDPDMHGLSWENLKAKYAPLIDAASCRQDVRSVIGELIGELGTSHTYVSGGDSRRKPDRVNVGMLGADWEEDPASRRFRFTKIYRVPDWTDGVVPPLAAVGVDVRPGDYLLRVNGTEVTTDRNFYSYFQNLGKKQVSLLVNRVPSTAGAREVTVTTLSSESTLRYLDWTEGNRRHVDSLSGGQIGYLHLPDTYTASAKEFPKYFYAQTRKKGMIVDGRFNGGGLDPDMFLERLNRKPLSYWTRRYSHHQTSPAVATRAHMVCLTNRRAGSGGDSLPMEFTLMGMGPVIGTRTWGGLVGVSMFVKLIDGGQITAPDYRIYDSEGRWVVENHGVDPDIVVDQDPVEMDRGYDAQLMTGLRVLQEKIKTEPRPWPTHEPIPIHR